MKYKKKNHLFNYFSCFHSLPVSQLKRSEVTSHYFIHNCLLFRCQWTHCITHRHQCGRHLCVHACVCVCVCMWVCVCACAVCVCACAVCVCVCVCVCAYPHHIVISRKIWMLPGSFPLMQTIEKTAKMCHL